VCVLLPAKTCLEAPKIKTVQNCVEVSTRKVGCAVSFGCVVPVLAWLTLIDGWVWSVVIPVGSDLVVAPV
jgi:hypothetical protein